MSHKSGDTDNHKADGLFIPSNCWGEDVAVDSSFVGKNLLDIQKQIAPCKPRIIGVTKYFGLNAIVEGYKAGLRNFGESRAKDAIQKINSLPKEVRENSEFHFIGHLQTNKAEMVVEYFDYIHSIDSLKLASIVSQKACLLNKRERVLLQVNNAKEEQKFGYDRDELKRDLYSLKELAGIEIVGLMNMAPLGASESDLRKIFRDLRIFRDELQEQFDILLPELSMGMSDDYQMAVQEGATMIRIGRKLFK